ncbi:alpha/beta fold hydrolase [Priestia filamentosa]|uniref:alpha/beta fold hydrolase n=1 Tax=Priestia filamentosa TaxID=1402861 RepID=UPI00397947FB
MGNSIECKQKQDIDGIAMYYEYFGKKSELPTIIFESGYGCPSAYWEPIKEGISNFTKMFIYDRAGIGESEKDERAQDSQQSVENLRKLLQKANVKPPYVLVGHSFGGLNVRLYAHTYPEEVIAIILLDSSHEDQNKVMAPLFNEDVKTGYFGQFSMEGSEDSFEEFEESLKQVHACKSLGDIPLVVVSAGLLSYHTPESFAAWQLFQRDLLHLSTNSKQIIIEDAGHALHIDQPKQIIQIIKNTVEEIK